MELVITLSNLAEILIKSAHLVDFRDYGTTRGFANESEFSVVKVDFYNDLKKYLAELENTEMRSLEDIVKYAKIC